MAREQPPRRGHPGTGGHGHSNAHGLKRSRWKVREAEKIRLAELEENDELEEDEMTLDDLATISDEDIQALESTLKTRFEDLNSEPITPTSLQEMMRLAADIERVRVEIKEREIRAGDDAWQAQLNKEDDE